MRSRDILPRLWWRIPEHTRVICTTVVLSLASATMSVAFLTLTNGLFSLTFVRFARLPPPLFLAASFVSIMSTALMVGLLLYRISPSSAGSGIPQLKAAYWTEFGNIPIKPVIVKFLAGILSIGGGTSLGREGPTVYMGGGLASWLSGYLGFPKHDRRKPALIGASAGLAAAFNTPLAAITFVLEEIVGDINSRSIGRVLISSIVGAFTVYAFIGRQPAFAVPMLEETSWINLAIAPFVALAASLLGIAFHRQALFWRGRIRTRKRLPMWMMPMVGAFITWAIGSAIYLATGRLGVFGLGYRDLSDVLSGDFVWWVAGILVAGKLVATVASYSFGGCGGIFSPLLFIGGLTGFFFGSLAGMILPLARGDLIVLAAVGMAACLGTVVKAPLSAMLIVFEMTHQFALVPALLVGMAVSMTVSKLSGSTNFYESILVQDGLELHRVRPPLDMTSWHGMPVESIANRDVVVIEDRGAAAAKAITDRHPYACFPVLGEGRVIGALRRDSILAAVSQGLDPRLERLPTCRPTTTVGDLAALLVESSSSMAAMTDEEGRLLGIITLHDLVRVQASFSD